MRILQLAALSLLAAVIICAVTVYPEKPCLEGGASYTFYCGTSSSDCTEITVTENIAFKKLCLKNVCGESTTYENCSVSEILEKFGGKVIFTEELSDSVNYYCTANLPYSVDLYGTKINLHVSVKGNTEKVATPIIFGGY